MPHRSLALKFEFWNFSGVWDLELGTYANAVGFPRYTRPVVRGLVVLHCSYQLARTADYVDIADVPFSFQRFSFQLSTMEFGAWNPFGFAQDRFWSFRVHAARCPALLFAPCPSLQLLTNHFLAAA